MYHKEIRITLKELAVLNNKDKQYIDETLDQKLDQRFADFEKIFDAKFTKLIDHMNDQFSRILNYIESMEKQTSEIPVVLARLQANDARLLHSETTHRNHEHRISKLEASK